jgi:hypothetical protein
MPTFRISSIRGWVPFALVVAIAACQPAPLLGTSPQAVTTVAQPAVKPVRRPFSQLLGKATFGGLPVVGATVTLRDHAGAELWRQERATDAGGVFHVPNVNLEGKDLQVTVEGGTLDGKAFPTKLGVAYDAFDAWSHILRVNAPTTLAARYLA